MQLRLWQKGDIERIYLQDVPGVSDNAYVELRRGKVNVVAQTMHEEPSTILRHLATLVGLAAPAPHKDLYAALQAHAVATARERGQRVGSATMGLPAQSTAGNPFGGRAYGIDLNFANIFNPEPVLIEIDHREPPGFEAFLAQVKNLTVERKHLPIGDFRINERILVERKSVTDFALSVQSGHVFDQAQRMGFEPDTIAMVVIEGDVFREHTGMLASAVTGAITCLSFVQRMSVVNTVSLEHTSYLLAKVAQHDRNGLGYNLPLHKNKPAALIDAQRYLVEAITGVSSVLSDALLRHFGSAQDVFNASEDALLQVKGIGSKTARRIREVLSAPY